MFKIITPDNRGEYRDLIHAMHEMRYRIVVEEWGWHIPGIREGYDKDQFDTDATFYVLVLSGMVTYLHPPGSIRRPAHI